MNSIAITIEPKTNKRKVIVEMDADKFERLAANFGFFNEDFLKSLSRAETDYRRGRVKKISSLKELK